MTCIINSVKVMEEGGLIIAVPFLMSNDQYNEIEYRARIKGRTVEEELILTEASKIV